MATAEPGFFVSVEGVDGSGKSTQAHRLAQALAGQGLAVTVVRDPGTTPLGERVRELLLEPQPGYRPEAWAEVALFLAARVQLLREVVEPALAEGSVVVADRYLDSTLVYQGSGRGLDQERLLELHRLLGADREPDLTLVLDLDVRAARRRIGGALPLDRMELEPTAYHERVRRGYLELAERFPRRVVVLDAGQPAGDLARACRRVVGERLQARTSR
ncbi:MAG: dTMP kinase [Candidatus Dormibacteria bacterium]